MRPKKRGEPLLLRKLNLMSATEGLRCSESELWAWVI